MPSTLDFIVIGAQKGGTTSLWQYLRRHPSIWMIPGKEAPFFCTAAAGEDGAFAAYMESTFADAPEAALLGKATPHYMAGSPEANVEQVATRIAAELPEVRLVALLRDPIDRAISQYRMSVRRGNEKRDLDIALAEQLEPERLREARERPTETSSYLTQGEYGRILEIYRTLFPSEQLHVELTDDLDRDPGAVLDRTLSFLSLPAGFRPKQLDVRYHRGGSKPLLGKDARTSLLEFMEEQVWPKVTEDRDYTRRMFTAFLANWDAASEEEPPEVSPKIRRQLESHYEADAETLGRLGHQAPWIDSWRSGRAAPASPST